MPLLRPPIHGDHCSVNCLIYCHYCSARGGRFRINYFNTIVDSGWAREVVGLLLVKGLNGGDCLLKTGNRENEEGNGILV